MLEFKEKHKIITIILIIAILANIGLDIYIHNQCKSINSNVSSIQAKELNLQKESKALLHKISDGKKNLSDIQK